MEIILQVFEENRKKWEYHFNGYIRKLHAIDKDDIANDVLIKIIDAYNNGKIDMDRLSNYMFITYRNHIYGLSIKKTTMYTEDVEIIPEIEENDGYIEIFEETNPIIEKIEKIIGVDRCRELISFYANKLSVNKNDINPSTGKPFNETDRRRYEEWRRKIKYNIKK